MGDNDFITEMKEYWSVMLSPPLAMRGGDESSCGDIVWRIVGWTWALVGLIGGAIAAPWLVQSAGLSNTPFQDPLVIGIAVFAGFLIQFFGWLLRYLLDRFIISIREDWMGLREAVACLTLPVIILLPCAGVGYGVYRFLTWIGPVERPTTIAFVGGLLVKTFLIPLIKGIVTGALFRWFMGWLRGGKPKSA
jgi:hypothetical protein